MMDTATEQIDKLAAATKVTNLMFVVGKPGSGKSSMLRELSARNKWQYVDCRNLLTDDFYELIPQERLKHGPELIKKQLERYTSPVILLDRLQVLFTPVLHLEPVGLLQRLSEQMSLVAAWPGDYEDGSLIFTDMATQKEHKFQVDSVHICKID